MSGLLDLATETLLQIWGFVRDPRAIENFALSCKNIYALSKPYVTEHHRLRQRFGYFENYIGAPVLGDGLCPEPNSNSQYQLLHARGQRYHTS